MTYMTLRVATLVAALAITAPLAAQRPATRSVPAAPNAVRSVSDDRPSGFMLGVYSVAVPGLAIGGGADQNGTFNTTFGGGAGVTLGYGFGHTFTAFTSLDLAKQNTAPTDVPKGSWGLVHLEIGARANLPLGSASTVPYLSASYGRRGLAARATSDEGDPIDVSISGKYVGLGAGVEHALSRTMALDAGVDLGFGKFAHFKAGTDEWDDTVRGTRSTRMRLGVTWRPGGRT